MNEHKAFCRRPEGSTIILCGNPGTGKSTCVQAVVRGASAIQPERSLTLRFHSLQDYSEEEMIVRLEEMFGLQKETVMSAGDLAEFLVDAVLKNEKLTFKAFTTAQKSFTDSMKRLLDGTWCTGTTSSSGGAQTLSQYTIFGLPSEFGSGHDGEFEKKPVIVLDDLNKPMQPDGPLQMFLRVMAERAYSDGVLVYMITTSTFAAYKMWQLNGGSKLYALPCTSITIHEQPLDWDTWKQREPTMETNKKQELQDDKTDKIPSFVFNERPFSFGRAAKKELLENALRPCVNERDLHHFQVTLDNVMEIYGHEHLDMLFVHMFRLGYGKAR
jgi:hypothetical protein